MQLLVLFGECFVFGKGSCQCVYVCVGCVGQVIEWFDYYGGGVVYVLGLVVMVIEYYQYYSQCYVGEQVQCFCYGVGKQW